MPTAMNTGVPLQGGTVNSPGAERQPENTLFNFNSTERTSHKFIVHESAVVIKAFNLANDDILYLKACTENANGEIQDFVNINGRMVALTHENNCLVIDIPGIYRVFCLETATLGQFTCVLQTTAMSYWTWGLAAYASAPDQSNNPMNPISPP